MGRKSLDQKRLTVRRREIADKMSALETELEKLRSEDLELAIAERVLANLSAGSLAETVEESDDVLVETGVDARDDGAAMDRTMTIGDMALKVLEEAGPEGLTSNEVLEKIRTNWLPALMRTSLSPPLSRLKDRGQITLKDERWRAANAW
jgi:hypothetical protein